VSAEWERILVDCTTCSPLAKDVKDYKPGKTADAGTKCKTKEYERASSMQRTDRSSIFFFAVETSGGLGNAAREFVKLLAKMSGDLSSTILRIYQTLAVEFQTARAEQPTLHHFLQLVFFILFLLLFILFLLPLSSSSRDLVLSPVGK
jgi:hypothetical protein